MLEDLRTEIPRALAGIVLVVLVAAAAIGLTLSGRTVPVGFVLIPVLGAALVCGPVGTALVGATAIGAFLVSYALIPTESWQLRLLSIVAMVALAVAGSAVRRGSERRLVRQAEQLAVARDHELTAEVTQRMLDRVAELSGATSVREVWRAATLQGRDLFGASIGTYWTVGEDCSTLAVCAPPDLLPEGYRIDTAVLAAREVAGAREARTVWVCRDDEPGDSERGRRMRDSGTVAWSSTPIRVDGRTVGYLTLGWADPGPLVGPAWLDLLDRYGDQVALAKTGTRWADPGSTRSSWAPSICVPSSCAMRTRGTRRRSCSAARSPSSARCRARRSACSPGSSCARTACPCVRTPRCSWSPTASSRAGYDEFVVVAGTDDPTEPRYLERLADGLQRRNGGPMPDDVAAVLISLTLEDDDVLTGFSAR